MNAFFRAAVCSAVIYCGTAFAAETALNKEDLTGFVDMFDGKTLNGWHKLTSYNNNGQWEVIDGAIAGDQWPEGEGGLLVTEKAYSNYEIYAEVKTTWPQDSGLFLRVQPNVLSYQVMPYAKHAWSSAHGQQQIGHGPGIALEIGKA